MSSARVCSLIRYAVAKINPRADWLTWPRLAFGQDDIYQHLMKEHFTCHICERNDIKWNYFKDYRALERHFQRQHFLCEDRSCLEKKFVVFGSALDLRVRSLFCR